MAVVPSVPVVGNGIEAKNSLRCRPFNRSPLSKLEVKVFVSQRARATSNRRESEEWREPPSFGGW